MAILIRPAKRVKKVKSKNGQEVLRRLEDFLKSSAVTGEPVSILCGFWEDQKNAISYQELRQAVADGEINQEMLQMWMQDYSILVSTKLNSIWKNAIKAGPTGQPLMDGLDFKFDTQTPGILNWISERGANFVTVSTQEQKDAIAALLTKKMRENHTVDELARLIRPCIGLTEAQAKANARYYDSIVENLKKNHPRMKAESIRKKALEAAQKYAERQHRERAMTIAQTESAFAYHRGADEGIRQARSKNLLGVVKKRWSTSGDDAVCTTCAALEGIEIDIDKEFDIKGKSLFQGHRLLPPAHPRCACAVEYIEVEPPIFTRESYNADALEGEEGENAQDRLGIFTNNDNTNPNYYDFKNKTMEEVEKELSQNTYETAVCFNKKGKAIFAQIGNEDSIKFTKTQLLRMKGMDVTHNHPNGTPPSPEDLYLLKDYKANSFRTTGTDGTYVLVYSEEVKNLPPFREFSDAYDDLKDQMEDIYFELIERGIGEKEALRIVGDNIWENLFKMYGVKPQFVRR